MSKQMMNAVEEVEIKELVSTDVNDFGSLVSKAFQMAKNYKDVTVHSSKLIMQRNKCILDVESGESYFMSDHAFSQLCTKMGVPVKYMNKCLASDYRTINDLVIENMNEWLDKNSKNLLLRIDGETVRGVLSPKYSICDSHEVLNVLAQTINPLAYDIKGYTLNNERLHVRMVNPVQLPVENEVLFSGIQIDSSDVGRNMLKVQFFIYKQVCTNGLVVPRFGGTLFEQKHIGIDPKAFQQNLAEALHKIPELEERIVATIVDSKNTWISNKQVLESTMDAIKNDMKFSDKSMDKLTLLLNDNYAMNRWGVVNALTELSQDFTLERRLEIEKYASVWLVA